MATFDTVLKYTLKWEGGYVNNPHDPGGATNYGIIQVEYANYLMSKNLPVKDVKDITMDEVKDIYYNRYFLVVHGDILQLPLAMAMFDTAVNFGVKRAVTFLQKSLGITTDGSWGPNTQNSVVYSNQKDISTKICDLRIQFRYDRVKQDPSQSIFLKGWLNRDNDLKNTVGLL